MAIKKRRILVRTKLKRATPSVAEMDAATARMGELLAAGYGTEEHARLYFTSVYSKRLASLQSIVKKAEAERSWSFLKDSLKLSTELYVLASVLYEKYPEHVMLSDGAYDGLARFLLRNMKKLPKDFREWYAINAIDLRAGTGHAVQVQEPIRWMVYLLTGKEMETGNGGKNRTRIIRKKIKRGQSAAPGSPARPTAKPLRRVAKRRWYSAPKD